MLYVPLEKVDTPTRFWRRLLAAVDRGHLLSPQEVHKKLHAAGFSATNGSNLKIFALTQPRSLGFAFNPVNFYFCYLDNRLVACLAHVNNTPWNEQHCYVLVPETSEADASSSSFCFTKRFHVSPFLPMKGSYDLRLGISSKAIRIALRLTGDDAPFSAYLSLRTHELTDREVLRCALWLPAQAALTLVRIYWQAVRLFLKGMPFYSHPAKLHRKPVDS